MRSLRLTCLAVSMLAGAVAPCWAQGAVLAPDSVLRRAQRIAGEGDRAGARRLADSVLSGSTEGSARYVDALYWRALFGESAEATRRDLLRITVEYPLATRAEDAVLQLAQIDYARGDRPAARRLLERLARERPSGHSRAEGALWLGRVLLEDGATLDGCAQLADARTHARESDVEFVNQVAYYSIPCAAARRAADAAHADSVARADSLAKADSVARADSVSRAAAARAVAARAMPTRNARPTARPAAPKESAWSAQVAAFSTASEAEQLAGRLAARGFDVRVTGAKPFRVRIGRFASRAGAVAMVQRLKEAKVSAIVVEAEAP